MQALLRGRLHVPQRNLSEDFKSSWDFLGSVPFYAGHCERSVHVRSHAVSLCYKISIFHPGQPTVFHRQLKTFSVSHCTHAHKQTSRCICIFTTPPETLEHCQWSLTLQLQRWRDRSCCNTDSTALWILCHYLRWSCGTAAKVLQRDPPLPPPSTHYHHHHPMTYYNAGASKASVKQWAPCIRWLQLSWSGFSLACKGGGRGNALTP